MLQAMEHTHRKHWDLSGFLAWVFAAAARKPMPETLNLMAVPFGDIPPDELWTEALMLRSAVMKSAGSIGGRLIRARYDIPRTDPEYAAAQYNISILASYCMAEHRRLRDRYLVADLVRDYIGQRRTGGADESGNLKHTDEWWAHKNAITTRTIRNYKTLISAHLGQTEALAFVRIETMLERRGIRWAFDGLG